MQFETLSVCSSERHYVLRRTREIENCFHAAGSPVTSMGAVCTLGSCAFHRRSFIVLSGARETVTIPHRIWRRALLQLVLACTHTVQLMWRVMLVGQGF